MTEIRSFVPSSEVLKEVTSGLGFPEGNIILWFAKYGAGKSSLLLDLAYDYFKQTKKKVLWVDTEGAMDIYETLNEAMLKKKYGVRDKPTVLVKITDLKKLFEFVGMKVDFETSGTGTVTVKYLGDATVRDEKDKRRKVPYSEFAELVKKEDVGVFVLDSVTHIFRTRLGGGREQLPARSVAYSFLLTRLLEYADEFGLIVFLTAHEQLTPQETYEKPKAVGASVLKHASKFWYYIEKPAFSNPKMVGFRRIYAVRFPNVADWSRRGVIEFTEDRGIIDSSEDEIEKRRAEIQKERKG
jgi:archaellum biogenesis ATPase FlaH